MNKLPILLKYSFLRIIAPFQGKTNRKSVKAGIVTAVVFALAIASFYSWSAWSMFQGLGSLGLSKICVYHACMTAFSCLLILSIMRAGTAKKMQDEDLLLSMPLKKVDIVISKALGTYLFDLLFPLLLLGPYFVIYLIFEGFKISILLLSVALILILPLMSVGISYVLQFIFSNIFNKMRFGNLLKCGLIVLLFAILMIFIIFRSSGYGSINPADIDAYINNDFVSKQMMNFMLAPDLLSIAFILGITFVPFLFGVFLLSKTLGKSVRVYSSKNKNVVFNPKKTAFSSLFKKEIGSYSQSLAFITNTIIGPVIMIALGVMLNIFGVDGILARLGIPAVSLGDLGFGFGVIMMLFMLAMTFISCSTISLEGKNFWVLKSSPVSEKQILLAKASLQLAITTPAVVITSILLLIALKLTLVQFVLTLAIPLVFSVLTAFGGLFINLLFPKLDWENETQVVKQSLAGLLTMFGGMVFSVAPIALYMLLVDSLMTVCLIALGGYAFFASIFVLLTFTVGVKMFRKIN